MTVSAQLLLLLDSRSPAGAHGHSGGLEAAVDAGLVRDLADVRAFCAGRLATAGVVAAAFAAAGCGLWRRGADSSDWLDLDDAFGARTPSEAVRTASRALGNGLRRLVLASFPAVDLRTPWALVPGPAPHHPLVLGAACALGGAGPELAARAAALGVCTSSGSAAVRLLGLDPYAVQSILSELGPQIDRTAARAAEFGAPDRLGNQLASPFDDLPADAAPAIELLADVHARSEVRLFAS